MRLAKLNSGKTAARTGESTLRVGIRANLPREQQVNGSMARFNIEPVTVMGSSTLPDAPEQVGRHQMVKDLLGSTASTLQT
jgi:hypothetical protein